MTITDTETESEFVHWAELELRRAGLFDADSDYGGMLGTSVMELVRTFSSQGHSGFSAMTVGSIFGRLVERKPLGELTNDPAEWMHIDEDRADNAVTWQSRRQGSCFSCDAGRTYYDIDETQVRWRRAAEWTMRQLRIYRPWQFTKRHVTERVA